MKETKSILFKDNQYFMSSDGAIYKGNEERKVLYAKLQKDGKVVRGGRTIGRDEDIEFINEYIGVKKHD